MELENSYNQKIKEKNNINKEIIKNNYNTEAK